MAVINKNDPPERWFDWEYPTARDINAHLNMIEFDDSRLTNILRALEELDPVEGLTLTTKIWPEIKEETQHYWWKYGDEIRIRRSDRNPRWTNRAALEEEFEIHKHTQRAIQGISNEEELNRPRRGFSTTFYDSTRLLHPILFHVRGNSLAHFLINITAKAKEKWKGTRYVGIKNILNYGSHFINDLGDRVTVEIPSRRRYPSFGLTGTNLYTSYTVDLMNLPTYIFKGPSEEKAYRIARHVNPLRMVADCEDDFTRKFHTLHKRWKRPASEDITCPHIVAAIRLDEFYREKLYTQKINQEARKKRIERDLEKALGKRREELLKEKQRVEAFLKRHKGATPYIAPVTYRTGPKLTYLTDIMDTKVVVKEEDKKLRKLREIEREALLVAAAVTYSLKQEPGYGYTNTLNAASGSYLVHFLDDPYTISFKDLQKRDLEGFGRLVFGD